jgi:hypothetical protein
VLACVLAIISELNFTYGYIFSLNFAAAFLCYLPILKYVDDEDEN